MVGAGEFGLEIGLGRAAHAGAAGIEMGAALLAETHIAGLRHEAVNDAVEDHAVIVARARQFLDARDMAGGQIGLHLDHDFALGGFHDERVLGVLVSQWDILSLKSCDY